MIKKEIMEMCGDRERVWREGERDNRERER